MVYFDPHMTGYNPLYTLNSQGPFFLAHLGFEFAEILFSAAETAITAPWVFPVNIAGWKMDHLKM